MLPPFMRSLFLTNRFTYIFKLKKTGNFSEHCCHKIPISLGLSLGTYRGAVKSLALADGKKQLKGRHFFSDAEVIAAAETWLDGQISDFFF